MDKQQAVGRLSAYLGGGAVGISAPAQKAAAKTPALPDTISLLQYPVPVPQLEITVGDITTVGGFLIVAARFGWDIWKDGRDSKKERDK